MSNSCKYIPNAPNGRESKLFREIQAHTHNRELTKAIWGFTQTEMFRSEFSDLTRDENGEPLYSELAEMLQLDSILNKIEKDRNLAYDMGLIDSSGKGKTFNIAQQALSKANEYNDIADSQIATVEKNEDGTYSIRLSDNTSLAIAKADADKQRAALNEALISIIQKLGFNVEFVDNPGYAGIFDPLLADKNAETLKTVIRVANGELGLDALPEEVSHLILAGLKGNAIKARADAAFTDDVVRRVLGDDYNAYYSKYSKGKTPVLEMLREEAEGKVLADILAGREVDYAAQHTVPLLRRIWNYAKSLFSKASVDEINEAIMNAKESLRPIGDMIGSGDIIPMVDRELVMEHEALYDLTSKTERLEKMVTEAEATLSKKLSILERSEDRETSSVLRDDINTIRIEISKQQYAQAAYSVMVAVGRELSRISNEIEEMGHIHNTTTSLPLIMSEAGLVHRLGVMIDAYTPLLESFADLDVLVRRGDIELDPAWAKQIVTDAESYLKAIRTKKKELGQMRFTVLKSLVSLYYGDMGNKPETFTESDKLKFESVETILQQAKHDIALWDTTVFSAGRSRNPLLNVIHHIVVSQQAKRDNRINKLVMRLQDATAKLVAAGHKTSDFYEYDAEGKPTGFFVSKYDSAEFYRRFDAFHEELSKQELNFHEFQEKEQAWISANAEEQELEYGTPDENGSRRKELLPKLEIYGNPDFQKGWDQAMKDYYKTMMDIKADMDSLLPMQTESLFLAPQVRKSVTQAVEKDARTTTRNILHRMRDKFTIIEEDAAQFGETTDDPDEDRKSTITLGFNNKPVKNVPIYYTQRLKDLGDLSTDSAHAMANYITMAVNYSEMGKMAMAMKLMQDHVQSDAYEVLQDRGGKQLWDVFKSMGRVYAREYAKPGSDGAVVVKAITDYIDRQFFGDTFKDMGNIKVPTTDKEVNGNKLFNAIMSYVSKARLGINALSGVANVMQGEAQLIAEAATGKHFGYADLAWAKSEYFKMLPEYVTNFNAIDRHDKMYLLINQFNSSEEFFKDMRDKDFNANDLKRVLGRGNIYFFNTMGEHYLHTAGMLAMLKHEKVKLTVDGKTEEVSLYDALKEVHDENGWHLELKGEVEFPGRSKPFLRAFRFTENQPAKVNKTDRDMLFEGLNIYVNRVNQGMFGGYSEAEKGNINRYWLGKLVMQFRQWMPDTYDKLYSRPYYDSILGSDGAGAVNLLWNRGFMGFVNDAKNVSIKYAWNHNRLSDADKRTVRVAYAQAVMSLMLWALCKGIAGWKDDDNRLRRLALYAPMRTKMELLALLPSPEMLSSLTKIIQSPAAGLDMAETFTDIFRLGAGRLESGRFKGWYKPAKALWTSTPLYNVQKIIDLKDYNYIFNIFN